MEHEVEGARQEVDKRKDRPKKTWDGDCRKRMAHKLNEEDSVDHKRWRKQIGDD